MTSSQDTCTLYSISSSSTVIEGSEESEGAGDVDGISEGSAESEGTGDVDGIFEGSEEREGAEDVERTSVTSVVETDGVRDGSSVL